MGGARHRSGRPSRGTLHRTIRPVWRIRRASWVILRYCGVLTRPPKSNICAALTLSPGRTRRRHCRLDCFGDRQRAAARCAMHQKFAELGACTSHSREESKKRIVLQAALADHGMPELCGPDDVVTLITDNAQEQ